MWLDNTSTLQKKNNPADGAGEEYEEEEWKKSR